MHEPIFQNYVQTAQNLIVRGTRDKQALQELAELIEQKLQQAIGDYEYEQFFCGEKAFFTGDYQQALKYYALAPSIPNILFFSYRVKAFLCQQLERKQEAIQFGNKALALEPTDYITLQLLQLLYKEGGDKQQEQLVTQKMADLSQEQTKNGVDKTSEEISDKLFDRQDKQLEESTDETPVGLSQNELSDFQNLFEIYEIEKERFQKNLLDSMQDKQEKLAKNTPISNETDFTPSSWMHLNEEEIVKSPLFNFMLTQPLDVTNTEYPLKNLESLELPMLPNSPNISFGSSFKDQTKTLEPIMPYHNSQGGGANLEKRLENFQHRQSELMDDYMSKSEQRHQLADNGLYILNGWTFAQAWGRSIEESKKHPIPSVLLPEYYRKTSGGFYLRWNRKGIVINPGMNFLQAFHQQQLYITDIDYVIITRDAMDSYADVKGIYDLNYQHNTIRGGSSNPHVINYYLTQEVFRNLSSALKPNFKQERHMLHCLELYIDSPNEETISIAEDIHLSYFQTILADSKTQKRTNTALGIRLDLFTAPPREISKKADRAIGFVLGAGWSEACVAPLKDVDALIAGFDKTNADDYNKLQYQADCLGYYGTYSLFTELYPKLLICCEFDGKDGDIRLEVIKKIRKDLLLKGQGNAEGIILPGDTGCYLNLQHLKMRCSVCNECVAPERIHVVKAQESFGSLHYLCPDCLL
ncbi:MAG: hypothetical protein K0S74_601 [Chlamydiales bacterium]|nr:hypothetical protein [Chlamydiales bacterium]